jgi:hypothetical protein
VVLDEPANDGDAEIFRLESRAHRGPDGDLTAPRLGPGQQQIRDVDLDRSSVPSRFRASS